MMENLELDLKKIARLGKQKEKENFDFRAFLKGQDFEQVDKIVHRLNKEITSSIDCQKCGNCCKVLRPCVTEPETKRLSELKNLSQEDFESKHVEKDSYEDFKYLKEMPCTFLKYKTCTIYADRPKDCRTYPNTHKTEFISRTFFMIENYEICPIVFNLFERLKIELGYRYF